MCIRDRYLYIKFPTPNGVGVVRGNQKEARSCYEIALQDRKKAQATPVMMVAQGSSNSPADTSLDPREDALQSGTPGEETVAIPLNEDDPSKVVCVGSSLRNVFRADLICLLTEYQDVFAWSHQDMPGIDPSAVSYTHLTLPTILRV